MDQSRGFLGDLLLFGSVTLTVPTLEAWVRYQFATFRLDTSKFELHDGGRACHVEPLVFDLLAFFARNPGRVVGRDEIVGEVWGGRAISDATISSCIKAARRALGDDGDSQCYIRTVRGRGFEFTAAVATSDHDASATVIVPSPTPDAKREAAPRRRIVLPAGHRGLAVRQPQRSGG